MSTAPSQIGRYRIIRPLGSGAMGDVFLAEDPNIHRELAIKTVRIIGGRPEEIEERKRRLLQEARAAGRMLHPNVVTLFDADTADGILYLAFEYVPPGIDLSRRAVSSPPLSLAQVLRVVKEVAAALEYAHQNSIIHRDIKPSNILLGPDGQAKVADFGIAKVRDQATELTRTGSVVGSPQYMSPEQVRGEELDGRSDLFSLGVVFYELLCRHRPFGGETLSTLVFEILGKEPMPVEALRPGLPPRLIALVNAMLSKHREQRIATPRQVIEEIEALEQEIPAAQLAAPASLSAAESDARGSQVGSAAQPSGGTATIPSSPPIVPPLPPIPLAVPQPGSPPEPTVVAPPPASPPQNSPQDSQQNSQQSTPLTSGTYAQPSLGGRRTVWLISALLVLALLGGWLTSRLLRSPATDSESPDVAQQAAASESSTESAADPSAKTETPVTEPEAEAASPANEPGPDTAIPGASPTSDESQAIASGAAEQAEGSPPAPEVVPPQAEAARPTRQTAPPRITTPTPPPTAPPSRQPEQATTEAIPTPAPTAPPAASTQPKDKLLARFDAAAAQARQEISTGRLFRFQVEPEDAIVRVWARGDSPIVQGAVHNFAAKDKDSRTLELPNDGDFLIQLLKDGYPTYSVLAHVSASTTSTPHVIRASVATRSIADGAVIRVRRAISFSGSPKTAMVYLDDRQLGPTSRWPGAKRPRHKDNLQLEAGQHRLRIEASGFAPYELVLEVGAAGPRVRSIQYRLRRAP